MKRFISAIAGSLMMFTLSMSLTTVAKSAEFFTIGTGWTNWSLFSDRKCNL